MRPGRGDITTTRSASSTASSMLWVMNTTVLRRLRPQRLQVDAHLLARERVERAEGLVHQQQRRVVDQRAHDRRALLHAARELARIAVAELAEPDLREQLVRAAAIGRRVDAAQLELQQHVVEHRAPLEQHRALEHDAERRSAGPRTGLPFSATSPETG